MGKKQCRARLEALLEQLLCADCGCWEEGYDQQFFEYPGQHLLMVWPTDHSESISDEPHFEYCNLNFATMLSSSHDLQLMNFHFSQAANLITILFRNREDVLLNLWIFLVPHRLVAEIEPQLLKKYLGVNMPDSDEENRFCPHLEDGEKYVECKECGLAMCNTCAVVHDCEDAEDEEEEYEDSDDELDDGLEPGDKQMLDEMVLATVVDMLVVNGKHVDESRIRHWTKKQREQAMLWCRASIRKQEPEAPEHVEELEDYGCN